MPCWPVAARGDGQRRWLRCARLRSVLELSEPPTECGARWKRLTGWRHSRAIRASANAKRRTRRAKSAAWSEQEQSSAASAAERVLAELAEGNARYEQRFGFTYIVCATGKSAEEMLAILKRRLANDRAAELREAAEQQRQITQIRLGKWLVE